MQIMTVIITTTTITTIKINTIIIVTTIIIIIITTTTIIIITIIIIIHIMMIITIIIIIIVILTTTIIRRPGSCLRNLCGPREESQEEDEYGESIVFYYAALVLSCITNANSKLRSTFFSIINNGIYENGIHPVTSLKIYRSVVLPKALYGCELWHDISKTQLVKLERSHKFSIKHIQCIDRTTGSDIALSLLGCRSLEYEIDYKKITLFGQLIFILVY